VTDRSRSGVAGALIVVIVLIVIILLLLTPTVQNIIKGFFQDQQRFPEYAEFSLERSLRIDTNGGTLLNYSLDVPRPVDLSENGYQLQKIQRVVYTPAYSNGENRYGVPWMVWSGGILTGQESYTVTIRYDVKVSTHFWNYGEQDALNISDIPLSLRNMYLRDEWKIITTSSSIQSRSAQIVGDEKNVYLILESIYHWISENIRYPVLTQDADPKSSVETLESKVGDCDDQAILFSALARAAGVPAWLQIGALYSGIESKWGGHGWVQTYVPLREGGGANVTIDTVNNDFLVWKPNRFADFTDDGNGDHLRDYYYTFYCTYQPGSYSSGQGPEYTEEYVALSYEESSSKVGPGDFLTSIFVSRYETTAVLTDSVKSIYTCQASVHR
jgi:hypothetical protein